MKGEGMSGMEAEAVAAYLAEHPDFFKGRDSLLVAMRVPHGRQGSVSLVERQMALLREGQRGSKAQLDELYQSAARNLELFDKSKRLALALIAAGDQAAFLAALQESLLNDFGCKDYSLALFGSPARALDAHAFVAPPDQARSLAGALAKPGKPALGPLDTKARDFLFGKRGQGLKSALLLALGDAGLLAIGGEGRDDFTPDMDTLFIGFVAEVMARLLPRHFA